MIDGMQMDAETVIVAPDLATLDLYCDRVAAAVGRLSVRAFGDASPAADRVAIAGPRAATHQHPARHARRMPDRGGGFTCPREYLDRGRGAARSGGGAGLHPACRKVCGGWPLGARLFRRGAGGDGALRPTAMKPARLMGATYAAILAWLEQSGWRDPSVRVSLPIWRKLWLLVSYGLA